MDDKILVVEDEIITAEHIKLALKKQGYQVVGLLISGKEAINKVEDTGVDLVFDGHQFKGRDGRGRSSRRNLGQSLYPGDISNGLQ